MRQIRPWILISILVAIGFVALAIYTRKSIAPPLVVTDKVIQEQLKKLPPPMEINQPKVTQKSATQKELLKSSTMSELVGRRDAFFKKHKLKWKFPVQTIGSVDRNVKHKLEIFSLGVPKGGYGYSLMIPDNKKLGDIKQDVLKYAKFTEDELRPIKVEIKTPLKVLEAYEVEANSFTIQFAALEHPYTGQQMVITFRAKNFNRKHQDLVNNLLMKLEPVR